MVKVLIADDQELIRKSLKIILNGQKGIEVIDTVENGQKVLESVERHLPEVILMDVRMPKMDGVQCTSLLKARYPEVKIIILTTFDDDEYVYNAVKNGADGYLLKGDSTEEIVNAILDVNNGKTSLNQDVTKKVVNLFTKMAKSDYVAYPNQKIKAELSKTDMEIIKAIACGYSNKEISEQLCLSEGTVRNYLSGILNKMEFRDRTQLAIWAVRSNISNWDL